MSRSDSLTPKLKMNKEQVWEALQYDIQIGEYGTKYWSLNGKLHRENGPAAEYANGNKRWYLNGVIHRADGPAIEYANGDKHWYLNGQCHRADGPAVEHANGTKYWYLNGKQYSEHEFNELQGVK